MRLEIITLLEEYLEKKILDMGLGNDLLDMTPKSTRNKIKNKQVGLHQTKKLPFSKRNNQQNE